MLLCSTPSFLFRYYSTYVLSYLHARQSFVIIRSNMRLGSQASYYDSTEVTYFGHVSLGMEYLNLLKAFVKISKS